jgi:hypothetical protein
MPNTKLSNKTLPFVVIGIFLGLIASLIFGGWYLFNKFGVFPKKPMVRKEWSCLNESKIQAITQEKKDFISGDYQNFYLVYKNRKQTIELSDIDKKFVQQSNKNILDINKGVIEEKAFPNIPKIRETLNYQIIDPKITNIKQYDYDKNNNFKLATFKNDGTSSNYSQVATYFDETKVTKNQFLDISNCLKQNYESIISYSKDSKKTLDSEKPSINYLSLTGDILVYGKPIWQQNPYSSTTFIYKDLKCDNQINLVITTDGFVEIRKKPSNPQNLDDTEVVGYFRKQSI